MDDDEMSSNDEILSQDDNQEEDFIEEEIPKIYGGVQVGNWLTFQGSMHFRQRLICSTLSGKQIKIQSIRENEQSPGINDHEASFLRLLEKITNGSNIVINETGTLIAYKPGIIIGGTITHDCPKSRGIGYFAEALFCLGPFGKQPITATLNGITNGNTDLSVDTLRTVTVPLLKKFGIGEEEGLEVKIMKRGAPPEGGGKVLIKIPIVRQLKPVNLIDDGKIRRIRGIAYCTRMAPTTSNRLVDSAKSILTKYQQDIFIYNDHYKGAESGLSPGYGLTLVAETTTGCQLGAESIGQGGMVPDDLGKYVSKLLLYEIKNRGSVDTAHQSLACFYMVLCPDAITKIRLGKLTPYTMQYLRHLNDFFGVMFRIETEADTNTLLLTCRGMGYKNLSKKVY